MARRRSVDKTISDALLIGFGSGIIAGIIAYGVLELSPERSIRLGGIAGGLGFGLWLVRPLIDWLLDRVNRQVEQGMKWWLKRPLELLVAASAFVTAASVARYVGGFALRESGLIGIAVATAALFLWWVMPLFRWIGDRVARIASSGRSALRLPRLARRPRVNVTPSQLRRLSPRAFEELCAAIATEWGYQARRVGESGDGGIDVEMWRDGDYVVAQCKHYPGRTVPISHVRDFYGAMTHRQAARGYFFTTGRFSNGAYDFVEGKAIELIDGDYLERILARLDRGEALAAPSGILARQRSLTE